VYETLLKDYWRIQGGVCARILVACTLIGVMRESSEKRKTVQLEMPLVLPFTQIKAHPTSKAIVRGTDVRVLYASVATL
jgi:hypothetical protein